jgi:hypothetical protein
MVHRPVRRKALAVLLSALTMIMTAPVSPAETIATASPLGRIVTPGSAIVGKTAVPTGTTIFAGDKVSSTQPALINFESGSRIEMTKAAATFSRQGRTLVVQASQGLIRFNFLKGEDVQLNAGMYRFSTLGGANHVGELGLNRKGQLVMTMREGSVAAVNSVTGARTEVSPSAPFYATDQGGTGAIAKGGKSLIDETKTFQADEFAGKCVVGATEAYRILGNTANVVSIEGAWGLETGNYGYSIVACTKEAMMAAGASEASAKAAAAAAGGVAGSGGGVTAAVLAGVVGSVGLGIGVHEATKSSSSRLPQ